MSADVHHLPPRCPTCQRPIELIHVFKKGGDVERPVRTYRCPVCVTGKILKES